jgi:hypothetical protein
LSQCLACYWGWSCQFVLVGSTAWLPNLLDLFLLILIHVNTSVFLSNCTPVSLHLLKCSCALTLSCLFTSECDSGAPRSHFKYRVIKQSLSTWW